MVRFGERLRQHTRWAGGIDGFVRRIVGGGIALVTGLWLVALFDTLTAGWVLGVVLVGVGLVGLGTGIWSEIDY